MTPTKIVVDTDVILQHLMHRRPGEPSALRRAMSRFFCYTTVFNAVELFSLCETRTEIQAVEDSLGSMKILGLNGKSGRSVGLMIRQARGQQRNRPEGLIAGVCIESRLPILTGRPERFRWTKSLRIVSVRSLERGNTTRGRS